MLAAHPVPLRGIAPYATSCGFGAINPLREFPIQAYGQHIPIRRRTLYDYLLRVCSELQRGLGNRGRYFPEEWKGEVGGRVAESVRASA
ncbi:MAG: hypothetical protein ACI8P2_003994 [Candidatus Latescibacterota bacterium]|jgi:hypothetical protein